MISSADSLWAALEDVAALRGGCVAVTDGRSSFTYAELTDRASGLAGRLARRGIGPGSLVGVFTEQTLDAVVAIVGVLRAGAAYVPLDVSYPPQRLAFMAQDAGLRVAVGAATGPRLDWLDIVSVASDEPTAPPSVTESGRDSPAYVIYTSGSTGTPKGCVVTHGNVLALFRHTLPLFDVGPADRWSVFHSFSFDFSVWELWGALLTGATAVCVPSQTAQLPEDLLDFLTVQRITVLSQVPSVFRALATMYLRRPADLALRYLVFGGESIDLAAVRDFAAAVHGCRPVPVNMYGVTEATVHATIKVLSDADLTGKVASPVGSALPHLTIELLDEDGHPVSVGDPGEIWISGASVASGYLNRPELTQERFVCRGARSWYRSGDLARQGTDGQLEYLGRSDRQVKLRGFRIELGEIESVLSQSEHVRAVAVVAVDRPSVGKVLVANVVPRNWPADASLVAHLRAHASARLPRHMVPSRYQILNALPLTLSGKLDRRSLETGQTQP
jgi:amino acid adenylation domain-containing protein